jgi:flagellar motor switch protein FliN/FliY
MAEQSGDVGAETPAASERPESAVDAPAGGGANIDLLLDIPLRITVELGASKLSIRELLQLGHGSVVELDKPEGMPLDVLVNGKPIARGEAVIVNERFGVRLTQIISPDARVEKLG